MRENYGKPRNTQPPMWKMQCAFVFDGKFNWLENKNKKTKTKSNISLHKIIMRHSGCDSLHRPCGNVILNFNLIPNTRRDTATQHSINLIALPSFIVQRLVLPAIICTLHLYQLRVCLCSCLSEHKHGPVKLVYWAESNLLNKSIFRHDAIMWAGVSEWP